MILYLKSYDSVLLQHHFWCKTRHEPHFQYTVAVRTFEIEREICSYQTFRGMELSIKRRIAEKTEKVEIFPWISPMV